MSHAGLPSTVIEHWELLKPLVAWDNVAAITTACEWFEYSL
jgi:hypothetical protein